MFIDHLDSTVGVTWVTFYDHGTTINEYGERVFGQTVTCSAYCRVETGSIRPRRRADGTFPIDERHVLVDDTYTIDPSISYALIGDNEYKVEAIWGGNNITGRTLIKVVRLLG